MFSCFPCNTATYTKEKSWLFRRLPRTECEVNSIRFILDSYQSLVNGFFISICHFTRFNLRHLFNQSDAKRNQSFLIDQSNFISLIVNLKKDFSHKESN